MIHRAALLTLCLLVPAAAQEPEKPEEPAKPKQTAEPPPPDPLDYALAPGKVVLGGEPKVGWRATQVSRAGGQTIVYRWAIVGETADAWRIEHQNPTLPEGLTMGLLVKKKDGGVSYAVAGKPGESGRPIRIPTIESGKPEDLPQESEETVAVAGGKFRARRIHHPKLKVTTWMGLEGVLKEVPLKEEGGMLAYELAAPPETVEGPGGELVRLRYTNGMTIELVQDPIVAAFFPLGATGRGLFATRGKEYTIEVSETGKDAKPTLKWE